MLRLAEWGVRSLAIDLRGFGDTQVRPVDATRGLKDLSDDVAETLEMLAVPAAHLVGWSMGGGVVMQLMLDYPRIAQTVTLVAPVSPYGFGATRLDGTLTNPDAAGTGGGGVNPQFVENLKNQVLGDENAATALSVYRATYVHDPGAEHLVEREDLWVESMLSTALGDDNYPGTSQPSEFWPGFKPGERGILNTMAPTVFNTAGIVDLAHKPPVLWVHGADDKIVADTSFVDINYLGQLGAIPGWPGKEAAPPQPMKQQTRAVLDAYARAGGSFTEVEFSDCGHSPHLEYPDTFLDALGAHVGIKARISS